MSEELIEQIGNELKGIVLGLGVPKWASITPRFEGDDVKRAPIDGDKHECRSTTWPVFKFGKWVFGHYAVSYCPYCGGKLPTEQEHE